MKKFAQGLLLILLVVLFNNQVTAQTFGIYADTDAFKTAGSYATDARTPNGGWLADGADVTPVTDPALTYNGTAEALHVQMYGLGDGRLRLNADITDPQAITADFNEWNAANAFLVFYVKLIEPVDFQIAIEGLRSSGSVDECDEPASAHGLDTTNTETWQKIILFLNDGLEGKTFDFTQFVGFNFRDRDFLADFYLDEVYVDYRPKTTFGLFADLAENQLAGSFATDPRTPNGGLLSDGADLTMVDDPSLTYEATAEAAHVQMYGLGDGRLRLNADITDPEAIFADFSEWNDMNAVFVFHIKLNEPASDFRVAINGLRNGDSIEESDESAVAHGLDTTNTEDWQKLHLVLESGLEGNLYDFSQFVGFNLRDRDNVADFYLDEAYVIYATDGTTDVGDEEILPVGFSLEQNYPNPFNPSTTIGFNMIEAAHASLKVYNVLGQQVAELINGQLNAGHHEVSFDASRLTSGTYFYKLESGNNSQVQKMLLLK